MRITFKTKQTAIKELMLKELNRYFKSLGLVGKLTVEQDQFGEWSAKWDAQAANLPEQLERIKKLKEAREQFFKRYRQEA